MDYLNLTLKRNDDFLLPKRAFKRRSIRELSSIFLKALMPPLKKGIMYQGVLLYGLQGSGKTTFVRWLASEISKNYGMDKVAFRASTSLDLLIKSIDTKPVQVLFLDDSGVEEQRSSKDVIGDLSVIRHIMKERVERGLVIVVVAQQDLSLVDKKIRSMLPFRIFKTSSSNNYDRRLMTQILGEDSLKLLDTITNEVKVKHNYSALSRMVATVPGTEPGLIMMPSDFKELEPIWHTTTTDRTERAFPVWEDEFTWRESFAETLQHSRFKKYYNVFYAYEVRGLDVRQDSKKFCEITEKSESQNYRVLRQMKNDKAYNGFLVYERSLLHEAYLAQKFIEAGWKVTPKPTFTHEDKSYEEDLHVKKGKFESWINAKCGDSRKTYVNDKDYKTTYLLHKILKKPACILYLDDTTGVHEVYEAGVSFAVPGNGIEIETIAKFAAAAKKVI